MFFSSCWLVLTLTCRCIDAGTTSRPSWWSICRSGMQTQQPSFQDRRLTCIEWKPWQIRYLIYSTPSEVAYLLWFDVNVVLFCQICKTWIFCNIVLFDLHVVLLGCNMDLVTMMFTLDVLFFHCIIWCQIYVLSFVRIAVCFNAWYLII